MNLPYKRSRFFESFWRKLSRKKEKNLLRIQDYVMYTKNFGEKRFWKKLSRNKDKKVFWKKLFEKKKEKFFHVSRTTLITQKVKLGMEKL